ncbi:MAG: cytochrome b/b6 domain-containing protein [Xanthomonadales bacterium]|nr:cytochrome b/b6 domain-containing protein [Xanthomonadales bacterium]
MTTVRVYDLPTRIFHWSFAALFVTAYAIANLVDDDSARFAWHMLAGLMLVATVVFRLVWGLAGTRHARFSDFSLRPSELANYLRGVIGGGGRRWAGHNPASSWAALSMMAIALAMGASGLSMALGVAPEWVEEAHEVLANALLAIALLHVAGLAIHVLRYRDGLPASIVSGHKRDLPDGTPAVAPRGAAALLLLLVLAGTGGLLLRGYSQADATLQLFGTRLQLGENHHASRNASESGHDD